MARNVLKSSLENASFNIIFQILYRCLTFVLNAFVLRHVSQDVIGVMNVRLLLLESTILFLSREAFRRACLSQTGIHSWPQIINLLWLTVPLSIINSALFGFIWFSMLTPPSLEITQHYQVGVISVCVSCVLEMCSEPLYLVSQVFLFVRLRVVLDSVCVIIRTLVFTPWVVYNPNQAVLAFSAAQLVAAVTCCFGYYIYFYFYIIENNKRRKDNVINALQEQLTNQKVVEDTLQCLVQESQPDQLKSSGDNLTTKVPESPKTEEPEQRDQNNVARHRLERRQSSLIGFDEPFPFTSLKDILPCRTHDEPWVHKSSVKLTYSFLKQGVVKQLLTEGERYVMSLFSVLSFQQQGVYDVVNNLGSLAARFLFRPVEDSTYFYFTQTVRREMHIKQQNHTRMKETSLVLHQVLHCITSLGLVILTFGQSYSTLLLYLYGGQGLAESSAPNLLRIHCLNVLLLAINGITECYANATMSTRQLDRYNYIMAVLSVTFLVLSWGLTRVLGAPGFIVANCCNMAARILHSIHFIHERYKGTMFKPLRGLNPDPWFIISLVASFIITKISESYCGKLLHFLVGGVCFVIVSATWCLREKELVSLAVDKFRSRRDKKQD